MRHMKTPSIHCLAFLALMGTTACGEQVTSPTNGGDDLLAAIGTLVDTKSDSVKSAKLIDDVAPDSSIVGKFDPRVRVYGYVVEARRGAELDISLSAKAGDDAHGPAAGADLDTRLAVYGPYTDLKNAGDLLVETDDTGTSTAAPPVKTKITEDGRYLVVFSSWEDTGKGDYQLDVACTGTDLQCRRPDFAKPCKQGQLFIQGSQLNQDTTWETCEVVLLEELTVAKDVTLTIRPGVTVRGNFLSGTGNNAEPNFGMVALTVLGTLQAVGTPDHPIAFTSLKEDRGWHGIILEGGPSQRIEHAVIERANWAIEIRSGSVTVTDTVLEGVNIGNRQSTAGILAEDDADATFTRALVKGFQAGLQLENAQRLRVEDSVIRDNLTGVLIRGSGRVTSCPRTVTRPTPRTTWRDPVFVHTDIINNNADGIRIEGSDVLIQVEKSNLIGNGEHAIEVLGNDMAPESFLRENNIYGNQSSENNARNDQVSFFHVAAAHRIDISSNYWKHVSDPELSQSWNIPCGGLSTFSGFSPTPIEDAGPREEKLCEAVQKQTYHATQDPQ
jgi:hypothetical protein